MPPLGDIAVPAARTTAKGSSEQCVVASRSRAGSLGSALGSSASTSSLTTLNSATSALALSPPRGGAAAAAAAATPSGWGLVPSRMAARTSNPVRNITDNLKPNPSHPLPLLNFSLGDPTAYSDATHLPCLDKLVETVTRHAAEGRHNGYTCSAGAPAAREALAAAFSHAGTPPLTAEDVIITSGGSGALEIVLAALLDEGDAVLIPRPGFALYQVIAQSLGAEALPYDLLPEANWALDLGQLEACITPRTKAILVNNPSNPCGNVLSQADLVDLLEVAALHRLPVISDEIYGQVVFPGETFYPLGALTREVPVLTVGGLAKQFAVPGWRVGWILLHDPMGVLAEVGATGLEGQPQGCSVRQGLKNLTQLILGANTLAQSVIPALFPAEPCSALEAYQARYVGLVAAHARFVQAALAEDGGVVGVSLPHMPQGALYMLLKLDATAFLDLPDDVSFCATLLQEENLVLLPGQCFGLSGYVRLVLTPPQDMLAEGLRRLRGFCLRHAAATETVVIMDAKAVV